MKHIIALVLAGAGLAGCAHLASVETSPLAPPAPVVLPQGVTEERGTPPPVPRFMLEPPTKPLTMEEMTQQIREAEEKAGIKRPAPR